MEYLQYLKELQEVSEVNRKVLNLVISGIPSIRAFNQVGYDLDYPGFKPCYKWNTFNTKRRHIMKSLGVVF